ncbi:NAD(P)H-binding protein [Pyxidicoccus fallax]|uniref:NAD(P)H-binding protein n=1 Tax=Pyxidicoccus fallax TaxID=394095 RepID=A0A848LHE3_9BACT|nr:NAD-dependent epimerase/dehydratase family protein [Pyxidicoccus fallax]NMO17215.1 NAD(P)H-binding protein [Pyxidicoccus fallax]NPC79179.1 NAD(P)H-binding protein [Pyxidicoccus fallax]
MKVILFGATGMVGQGVLRECLLDDGVEQVLAIGRSATGQNHAKLREIVHKDLLDYSAIEGELSGYDACFFCLGVSSAGMAEADYTRVTYDLTLAAARVLARLNPGMTFIYVSGVGTDSSEKGRAMWARVKGRTENALLQLPFKAKYMFRPGFIQPMHGIVSKTKLYRVLYAVVGPLYPVWKTLFPKYVTTTEQVGRAMLHVACQGAPKTVLENEDINALAPARA